MIRISGGKTIYIIHMIINGSCIDNLIPAATCLILNKTNPPGPQLSSNLKYESGSLKWNLYGEITCCHYSEGKVAVGWLTP